LRHLQQKYLAVYLMVMGADWLQGPYLYKLYRSYGLDLTQIALLFLTGFLSSAFAGTAVGSTADTSGRRRLCLFFCGVSSLSLILRQFNVYSVLFLSHVLSGMAAALLYSVFEAWYVAEHTSHGLPEEWRAHTFALATFFNSVVAVVAGLAANGMVVVWGYSAPYVAAVLLQTIAAAGIYMTWTENYGEHLAVVRCDKIRSTLPIPCLDTNLLCLGAAQTLFECSMYVFVLLYTPALEGAADEQGKQPTLHSLSYWLSTLDLPLGLLFSTMMLAVMLGSLLFRVLGQQKLLQQEHLLTLALGIASGSFAVMAYYESHSVVLLTMAYHGFEFTTGLYYPSMASLKAHVIPEETRVGVMTLLRIPMNLGVGLLL
ncbi:molybdate-anion transporter MOT2, partial [Spinellus fusiger]